MQRAATAILLWLALLTPVAAQDITIPLGAQADKIEVFTAKGTHFALVGLLDEQVLAIIDLDRPKVEAQIPLGIRPLVTRSIPGTSLAVIGGPASGNLVIVDLEKQAVVREIDLQAGIFDIAVDGKRKRIIATHPGAERISVVDTTTNQVRVFPMPGPPLAAAIDPQSGRLLVTLGGSDPLGLLVVRLENGELLARLRSGTTPEDMAFDTEGRQVVLLNSGSNDLTVVPLGSGGGEFRTIGLDWRPTRLALSRDGRFAYVTARDSDRLQVVDLDSGRITQTRRVGKQPTGIGLLDDGSIVIAESGSLSLHRLSLGTPAGVDAEPLPGAVAGTITDMAGKPVGQGFLKVEGRTVPIAPDGSFLIQKLPAGKYLVDVQVPGFPAFSARVQSREGYVISEDIPLPPRSVSEQATGVGFLADAPQYSELLARTLVQKLAQTDDKRKVLLLNGPLGPHPDFVQLAPRLKNLNLLDRDNRYTNDLEKLHAVGRTLGLRYVVVTQVQSDRNYDTRGNPIVNTLLRFFVPVSLPNFTPNQLRSKGIAVVVDLDKARVGDKATVFKGEGGDEKGGAPLYEESADGLFRLEVKRVAEQIATQWEREKPFDVSEDKDYANASQ
ncbi:MAG: YncE family protein [Gemmatimonadaceae bacterium]|nr:YncE family protein [Gloeobacterales cyanobacterium ES-bin-141]